MQSQSYPTKESIETITKELNLKSPDIFIQDWECGVADSGRIQEFISYYNETALSSNEKIALIRLILESYNDYVAENGYCMSFSEKIKTILLREKPLFEDIINYWSCTGYAIEDSFRITPFMRKVQKCS